MKWCCFYSLVFLMTIIATSQESDLVITERDMFNESGLFYRAYVNETNPNLSTPVLVSNLIGEKGGPHLWDFTTGPQDDVLRFDYFDINEVSLGEFFPGATFVERKTVESNGVEEFLFLEQVTGVGRRVYGFFSGTFEPPNNQFLTPIIDFPDQIKYGDSWSNTITFPSSYLGLQAIINQSVDFEVDAFGILELPELGFGETLRINSLTVQSTAIDFTGDGTFQDVGSGFFRTYYWLRPGLGIAAQMVSQTSISAIPPDNFLLANSFSRLFETNKVRQDDLCKDPDPVSGLALALNSNIVLIKWNENECANSYRVEYLDGFNFVDTWQELGTTSKTFITDSSIRENQRYYRVIPLK